MIRRLRYRTYEVALFKYRLEINAGVPWALGFGYTRDEVSFSLNLPHLVLVLWMRP